MPRLSKPALKEFLDEQLALYNHPSFIAADPVSIPHLFSKKEDREISGFLAATIAWGQRPVILKNANRLMELTDFSPHDFILNHTPAERKRFRLFVHRTFNGDDAVYFIKALQILYRQHNGLEGSFTASISQSADMATAIHNWRQLFLSFNSLERTGKHVADPLRNSSAKRICMYLRWMVRKDKTGVDFGIWNSIQPSALYAPLDLHSGRVARSLGLLKRKQNDWKAVEELTLNLRKFDAADPVKYDFVLFGAGAAGML